MSKVLVGAEAGIDVMLLVINTICGRDKLQQGPPAKSQAGVADQQHLPCPCRHCLPEQFSVCTAH